MRKPSQNMISNRLKNSNELNRSKIELIKIYADELKIEFEVKKTQIEAKPKIEGSLPWVITIGVDKPSWIRCWCQDF